MKQKNQDISILIPEILSLRDSSRTVVRELGFFKKIYSDTGLTSAQNHILFELDRRGSLKVTELSNIIRIDISTASRTVKGLLNKKLITFHLDSKDRREKPLKLTALGKSQVAKFHENANNQVYRALDLLSDSERETVLKGMALYAQALKKAESRNGYSVNILERKNEKEILEVIHLVLKEFNYSTSEYNSYDGNILNLYKYYNQNKSRYFVLEKDGKIYGGAGIAPLKGASSDTCELQKMYLLPEARHLGFGKNLLNICLQYAKEAGYKQCYIETVAEMNKAIHLYKSMGFKVIDKKMGNTGHYVCTQYLLKKLD